MIKVNEQFSISFLYGYYQVHEHYINSKNNPAIKAALTYANDVICKKVLLEKQVLQEELEAVSVEAPYIGLNVFEQAKLESGIATAKDSVRAKKSFKGFAKKGF